MKHEHDGMLYYHIDGNLTFQSMEHFRRNGWIDASCRIERIHNDEEYNAAMEAGRTHHEKTK